MTKTFLVQIELAETTKLWTLTDQGTAELIKHLIDLEDFSSGPIPKVTVEPFPKQTLNPFGCTCPKNAQVPHLPGCPATKKP